MKERKLIEKLVKDTKFCPMDMCQLCGGYDTIQTYINSGKKFKGMPIYIHICEKCVNKITGKEPS